MKQPQLNKWTIQVFIKNKTFRSFHSPPRFKSSNWKT